MATLLIHKPELDEIDDRIVIQYVISLMDAPNSEKREMLWFSINKKHRDFISLEVCDPIIILLLQYCLKGGYDIESEIPITERLYYAIVSQYLPQMLLMNPSAHLFHLRVETTCPDWKPTAVATAMSCGIDSLTTFFEYTSDTYPAGFQLTHLTFYEQGAHHKGGGFKWEEQDKLYQAQLEKIRTFCDLVNFELIDIRSNLTRFFQSLLWAEPYYRTHTYRNMAFTLLLQKLIKTYYYAAAYNLDQFSCSINDDTARYEKWLLPTLSTAYTSFFSANSSLTRLEKIKLLSEKPVTYNNVLVCYKEGYNCGTCSKCRRTMLEMEVCGVLDLYRGSFDVDSFRKNDYNSVVSEMLRNRKTEPIMQDIYNYMVCHNIEIPSICLQEERKREQRVRRKKSIPYRAFRKAKRLLRRIIHLKDGKENLK